MKPQRVPRHETAHSSRAPHNLRRRIEALFLAIRGSRRSLWRRLARGAGVLTLGSVLALGAFSAEPARAELNYPIPFIERTGDDNPLDDDAGDNSAIDFVDIDNDGDYDAFVGKDVGAASFIALFENTGTPTEPEFQQNFAINPFDGENFGANARPVPRFVDIDDDDDIDIFVGLSDGTIKYYENIGTSEVPNFVEQLGGDNPFGFLNLVDGTNMAPEFADIDADGDYDAFVGKSNPDPTEEGFAVLYRNVGTPSEPDFDIQDGDPFGDAVLSNEVVPAVSDVDQDGDYDVVLGKAAGTLSYFENVGDDENPSFEWRTASQYPFVGEDVGDSAAPTFVDINGDGFEDAFIGAADGTANYFENEAQFSVYIPLVES